MGVGNQQQQQQQNVLDDPYKKFQMQTGLMNTGMQLGNNVNTTGYGTNNSTGTVNSNTTANGTTHGTQTGTVSGNPWADIAGIAAAGAGAAKAFS
jgi:hypothetical protein